MGKTVLLRLILLLLLAGCGTFQMTGGSTTVESPYIICSVTNTGNAAIPEAKVALYPKQFNPLVDDTNSVLYGYSDSIGIVRFDSVEAGIYSLLVTCNKPENAVKLRTAETPDGSEKLGKIIYPLVVDSESRISVNAAVLPLIKVQVNTSSEQENVYFGGTPFIAVQDSVNINTYNFNFIPVGSYPPLYLNSKNGTITKEDLEIGYGSIIDSYDNSRDINLKRIDAAELDYTENLEYEEFDPSFFENSFSESNYASVVSANDNVWFGATDKAYTLVWSISEGTTAVMDYVDTSGFMLKIATNQSWSSGEETTGMLIQKSNETVHYKNEIVTKVEESISSSNTYSNTIYMDSSDRCWVAYDSDVFYTVGEDWSGKISLDTVSSFTGNYDDTLYIGQQNGTITGMNSQGTFTLGQLKSDTPSVKLLSLAVTSDGTLYAGTDKGIFQKADDNSFSQIYSGNEPVRKLIIGDDNSIYGLLGQNSIYVKSGSKSGIFNNIGEADFEIYDIAVKESGSIYIAAGDSGAYTCSLSL